MPPRAFGNDLVAAEATNLFVGEFGRWVAADPLGVLRCGDLFVFVANRLTLG